MKQSDTPTAIVSRETRERLDAFAALLLQWNRRINLISRGDEAALWLRHIEDSLQLVPLVPEGIDRAIDLGSGAGFPGLILAIATGVTFHLVESDARKAAFLLEAARATAAPVEVHRSRIEQVSGVTAPLITARALAPVATLLGWSVPLLTADGICLFPKGRTAKDELTAAASEWHMNLRQVASITDPSATILQISEIRRAGDPY